MRAHVALAVVLAVVGASGCGTKRKKQRRTGDAAPVVVVPTPVFDGGPTGTTTDEVEPNDSADVATPLPVGGTARGKIDPDTDADYYRIEISEPGALTVTTSAVDADLSLEIEDAGGTVLAKSERGGARVREGVPNLGVTPGRYTAIVRRKPAPPPKRGRRSKTPKPAKPLPPVSYELVTSLAPPPATAEHEPDDDRGTANDLIVGDAVTGFVGWTGDTDVWKLSVETLSAKNSIDIEIGAIEGVAVMLELADGVGQPLLARKGPRGAPLVARNIVPIVPSGAPPFHYLTIKSDRSNPETPYTLRVTAKPVEPDAEIEPNDAPDKAMPFPSDRTRVDGVWTAGDVDCFAIAAEVGARTLEIAVVPSDEIDLSVELLIDGKAIAKSELKGKGTDEKLSAEVPPNTTAVVRVRGVTDASGEGAYELTVREGPAQP